jgi:hypothetical protein
MRRILIATLTSLLLSGSAYGAQGTGTVQGVVRRADTKEPISDATVQIVDPGYRLPPSAAVTDSAGRFRFANLAAGRYLVQANKDAFFIVGAVMNGTPVQSYLARTDGIVGASSTPTEVVLELLPGGRITGRVFGPNGTPAANVGLTPMTEQYEDGLRTLRQTRGTRTDDRGEFRIWGLSPGKYYLSAQWQRVGQNPVTTTYYPSAALLREAQAIDVRPDREELVEIKAAAATPVKISGKAVTADPTPLPATNVQVFGLPRNSDLRDPYAERLVLTDGSGAIVAGRRGDPAGNGAFETVGLTPGLYDLFVLRNTPTAGNTETIRQVGKIPLDVRDRDIAGLTVPLSPTFDMQVRAVGEGQLPSALYLRPLDPLPLGLEPRALTRSTRGAPQGTWTTFSSVITGRYFIDFTAVGTGYVSDIRQGTRSIYEDGVITAGENEPKQVEVTIARQGGTVQGVVQDATGKPIPSAQVVLIPEGRRRSNPLFYRRGLSGTDGQITLAGVAPGSYKVFAWDNLPSGAERNAKFMEPFEQRGRVVTVSAPGVTVSNIVVPLIRR